MPYINISGHNVFLYSEIYSKIKNDVLRDKSASYRTSSIIAGTKECLETEKLMIDWLKMKNRENSETFYKEYVNFSIGDEYAKIDIFDLLFDWCDLSRLGYIVDNRDSIQKILSDYEGDSIGYPAGKIFGLEIKVCSTSNVLRRIFSAKKSVYLQIDTAKVTKLEGHLEDFQIYMGQLILSFSKEGIQIEFRSKKNKKNDSPNDFGY